MLMAALQVEVAQYVDAYQEARDASGRRLVVRHGQAEARKVTCGAGTVEVRAPRVNDKRVDATGQRERFTSRILPPYMRRSPKVAEVLPILYLRGGSVTSRRGTGRLLDVSCCLSMNCQRPRVERSGSKAAILLGA